MTHSGPEFVADLRSDTRTSPDKEMRAVIAAARVGDDSFGDDPTVRSLEQRVAELTGKPAALFTCSGTMSNLLAVLTLTGCDTGARVVTGAESHLVHYENDGARTLGRCEVVTVPDGPYGELDQAQTAQALVREADRPGLVCLENTSNRCGGSALAADSMRRQTAAARRAGAWVHLDGARLPNAAVALGCALADLTADVDTVAISLCKGLGAPAGSVLAGAVEVVDRARFLRRMLGGTMHQSGVLAAAGHLALDRIPDLVDDHRRAADLAGALTDVPGVTVRDVPIPTNMVVIRVEDTTATRLAAALGRHGVLGLPLTARDVRLVVHREHTDEVIRQAAERCAHAVRDVRNASEETAAQISIKEVR